MSRPVLYDVYCCAGGAIRGYQRAGFEVWGVDNRPQPRYCGERFIQMDALAFIEACLAGEYPLPDAWHASPPCEAYIRGGLQARDGRHPDLLGATRAALATTGRPWVIENVPGAPMRADVILCGSMFGLPIRRHRWFEGSPALAPWTPPCDHSAPIVGVYGHPHGSAGAWKGMLPGTAETWTAALGIDWMTPAELALAIPPAYTECIGRQLLDAVRSPLVGLAR